MMYDKCTAGHCNFDLFLTIVFNFFAKNELKKLHVPENEPTDTMSQKIRKVMSGSSKKRLKLS